MANNDNPWAENNDNPFGETNNENDNPWKESPKENDPFATTNENKDNYNPWTQNTDNPFGEETNNNTKNDKPWAPEPEINTSTDFDFDSAGDGGTTTTEKKSKWEKVCKKLRAYGIPEEDIIYMQEVLNEEERKQLSTNAAILYILQYKFEQAKSGNIVNRGTISDDPSASYRDISLPRSDEYNALLQEMNDRHYMENKIQWKDYKNLDIDDVIDFRKDDGFFVLARVVKKEGIKLTLITDHSRKIVINYLEQYPYQRLFKGGSVTQRVPEDFRDKKIKMEASFDHVNGHYVSHQFFDQWVEGIAVDFDTKHTTSSQIKQIKLQITDLDDENIKYSFWTHLDNKADIDYDNNLLLYILAGGVAAAGGAAIVHQYGGGGGMGGGGNGGGSWDIDCDDCGEDCCDVKCDDCCDGDCDCDIKCDCCDGCCECDCDFDGCCECGGCDCDCDGCCDCGGCNCTIM